MLNFNSTMGMCSSHQFEKHYSNPNPNFDQLKHIVGDDQLTKDTPYFHILNFLMSDEVPEESVSATSNMLVDSFNGSSNSIPSSGNIKCKRGMKKYKTQEEFRFAFRTKSDLDFMDDGFKWRKYGKKMVKSSPKYPRFSQHCNICRNYFKCTSGGCSVKKRVERDGEDPSYVITTYEGIHNHETPSTTCYMVNCSSTATTSTPQPSSLIYDSSSF